MATCDDCGADTLWLRFATSGRPIAVNETRVVGGNIEIGDAGCYYVKPSKMEAHFMPHVATCPEVRRQRAEEKAEREKALEAKARKQMRLF